MLLVVISSVTTLLLLRGLETAPFLFIFCFLSLPLFLRLVSLAILEEEVEEDEDVGDGVDLFADAPDGGGERLIGPFSYEICLYNRNIVETT